MSEPVLRLYPPPASSRPINGLYLEHDLQRFGRTKRPFVFTNFIVSLDGRIALPDVSTGRLRVPPAIANPRDWRLYLELAAQADVLVTTGRHLRSVGGPRRPPLLSFEHHPDLIEWRREHGLPDLPGIAAVTESLDLPKTLRERYAGPLFAVTSESASEQKAEQLRREGIEVLSAGPGPALEGEALVRALSRRGWHRIYSVGGPRLTHTLLDADVLDRLYLTITLLALGGREFDSLTRGETFAPARGFRLLELHLDTEQPAGFGQLFATFEHVSIKGP